MAPLGQDQVSGVRQVRMSVPVHGWPPGEGATPVQSIDRGKSWDGVEVALGGVSG